MPRYSNDQLVAAIYVELDRSVAYSATQLRENRRKAWNYYLNRPRGDEIEGRSQVQDTTVRDTVHALLAQIMPAYHSDTIVRFEPSGPDDIDQAEAESMALNALFTETNQGYLELHNAISDALLFRNGVLKIWVEEREEISQRSFAAPPADVKAAAPPDQDWEHIGTEDGLATFRIKSTRQKLEIQCIEQARLYVNPNQEDQVLSDTDFIAELVYFTRSELVQMGISKAKVADLPCNTDQTPQGAVNWGNTDVTAKYIDGQHDVHQAATEDRELIECFWVHMDVDRDGDGISEKYRFLVSHREMLLDDPVDFFPYASGCGWIVPHRWSGLSVYDLTRITQDERTNARRQLNDNLNVANNQRPIYDPGETEQADVNAGAPGRGIRSRNPGNVAFMPVQDVVSNSVAYLQYMDQVRSEQTGAALEMASAQGQLAREVSGISADIQLQPREQMAAMVSRNIAETLVRNTFLLIHRTLRQEWNSPIIFEKSGEWQQTMPREWIPRERLNVAVGLTPGERRRTQAALTNILNWQFQMIGGGAANITTDWNGIHKALTDYMNATELDSSQGYFIDPDSQQSQAAMQAAAQQAEQQKQMQMQMMQMQMQLEQGKVGEDARQHDTELQFKYWKELIEDNTEREKIDVQERQGANGTGGEVTGTGASRND